MRLNLRMVAFFLLGPALCSAARLSQTAESAFETYITSLELRLAKQHAWTNTYLAVLAG